MLVKFEQNRVVQTTRNYELFDKTKQNKTKQNKNGFFITIFGKELTSVWKTFL